MDRGSVILAVDHGTSALKTALVTATGEVLATAKRELTTDFLPDGGAEQDPGAWWEALLATGAELLAGGTVEPARIAAVAVSSTFSSTVAVAADGRPVMPCMTWMDGRGAPHVRRLMAGWPSVMGYGAGKALRWIRRTGGAPSLSGKDDLAHALWLMHQRPELYARTHMFLPSKDYLNLCLTGRWAASTDAMGLFWLADIRDPTAIRYDADLIRMTGLDPAKLPPLKGATDVLGPVTDAVADRLGIPRGTPVVMGAADHQAAGIGSGAVDDFAGHLYVGTSSWIQCPVPFKRTDPLHSIASLPHALPGRYYCANEQDLAGGCLEFLLHNVVFDPTGLADHGPPPASYELLDALAADTAPGAGGLLFCPWLNGERTPVDNPDLGGILFNLSPTTTQAHIVRAVLEGVALNARWCLGHVERFCGRPFPDLRIIGGGALSETWCQVFADALDRPIRRVTAPREANARGAALLAGLAFGVITTDEIADLVGCDTLYAPRAAHRNTYDQLFRAFRDLYRLNRRLFRRLNRRDHA